MLQRAPQRPAQTRRDPYPHQGGPPSWFLAKEASPSPSVSALASPQRGLKKAVFFPAVGSCSSPHTWGLPDPPEPWPTSALEFYPGGAKDLRI